MYIIGLTGSIGMGKTTVAHYIAARGVPVLDTDAVVHKLYTGEVVPVIEAEFPGTTSAGQVNRGKLSQALLREPERLKWLEALIHPLVRREQWRFLEKEAAGGAPLAVLDVPLLFETGADQLMDATIVVSAPAEVQAERVLQRPGMTAEKLEAIRARQLPAAEKRARASYVVDTGAPWEETRRQVDKILESLAGRHGDAFERWRRLFAAS